MTSSEPTQAPAGVDPEFMAEVEEFLEKASAEFGVREKKSRDRISLFPDLTPEEEQQERAEAQAYRQYRFDAGFGWLTGPKEYGGRGLTPAYERAYLKAERKYLFPPQRIYDIGMGMVAPTFAAFATEEAKQSYLRPMYRGDIVGCQLFSEPGAGSDLSSISSSATFDGEVWHINGQKVWSSGAHISEVGLLVCRTGAPDAKHRNLTAFILPMDTPGVTVRPIRQMTGGSSFNEVFFDDVQIPDGLRLGEVDKGWDVVIATLMNERAAVGGAAAGGSGILSTQRLADLLARYGRLDDAAVRDELMKLHCSLTVARLTRQRSEANLRAGHRPGPEMSLGKISLTNNLAAVTKIVGYALGPRLIADNGEEGTYAWAEFVLGVPGLRLGGGTDEIQKNILAERVLGLPRS